MLQLFKLMMSIIMFTSFVVENEAGGSEENPEDTPTPENDNTKEQPEGDGIDENEMNQSILRDEAKLGMMQEEFTQMTDSIANDFETVLANKPETILTEDEIEILEVGSDFVAKNKLLRDKFEAFRDEKLSEKKELIDAFSGKIKTKKGQHELVSQSNKFARENPKVNMEELAEYIQEDLSNRKKQEFLKEAGNDKYKFLELVAKDMGMGTDAGDDEELPTDLTELSGTSADQFDSADKAQAYLSRIGGA